MTPLSFPGDTTYRVIYDRDVRGAVYSVTESIKKMDSSFACFKADTASLCGTTSIVEFLELGSEVKLYPNPTSHTVNVDLSLASFVQVLNLSIIDITGRVVLSKSETNLMPGQNQFTLENLSSIPSGIYILSLEIEGQQSLRRLVIQ